MLTGLNTMRYKLNEPPFMSGPVGDDINMPRETYAIDFGIIISENDSIKTLKIVGRLS